MGIQKEDHAAGEAEQDQVIYKNYKEDFTLIQEKNRYVEVTEMDVDRDYEVIVDSTNYDDYSSDEMSSLDIEEVLAGEEKEKMETVKENDEEDFIVVERREVETEATEMDVDRDYEVIVDSTNYDDYSSDEMSSLDIEEVLAGE